jgi:hypothetical protein
VLLGLMLVLMVVALGLLVALAPVAIPVLAIVGLVCLLRRSPSAPPALPAAWGQRGKRRACRPGCA